MVDVSVTPCAAASGKPSVGAASDGTVAVTVTDLYVSLPSVSVSATETGTVTGEAAFSVVVAVAGTPMVGASAAASTVTACVAVVVDVARPEPFSPVVAEIESVKLASEFVGGCKVKASMTWSTWLALLPETAIVPLVLVSIVTSANVTGVRSVAPVGMPVMLIDSDCEPSRSASTLLS